VRAFFKYYGSVLWRWRTLAIIVPSTLSFAGKMFPAVEHAPWYPFVPYALRCIAIATAAWTFYDLDKERCAEIAEKNTVIAKLTAAISDRTASQKIALRKLHGDLQHNLDFINSPASYWLDNAWVSIDEALPLLSDDLVLGIQEYYRNMRAIRQSIGSMSSETFASFNKYARNALPTLIDRLKTQIGAIPS
jgi:hypothetical protein